MRKLKKYKPTKFMAKTSHYDKDAADYAVMFIESLCHTKGTWAGKPFELIDWQEQIIRDLFGVLNLLGHHHLFVDDFLGQVNSLQFFLILFLGQFFFPGV